MKQTNIHYGYVIVFCCCLIMGIDVGLPMSCAGIFYQPVSEELGVTVGKFGLYMSFNFLASTLMLSIAGKMMERFSARLLLSLSSIVLGLTFVAMGFFNAVWQFYIAGGVTGATLAFLLYLSFPTLLNRWFRTRVGFFIGVCSAASGIGGILFNPVGAWLITNYGWRTTYGIFGAIVLLVVTPIIALLLRNYPKDKDLQAYGEETSSNLDKSAKQATLSSTSDISFSRAIRMPVFYGLIVFAFLLMAVSTLNLFIPKYVTGLEFSLEQASLVASAVMVGVTVGKIILGLINDRNNLLGVITTVTCGIVGIVLLLAGGLGFWAPALGGFLFGWEYAGVTVQTPMLVRAVFGSKDYTQIYSNISIALAAGGAVAAGGWGLLSDATSFQFIFTLGIILLAVCGAIGIYALKSRKRA